MRISRILPILLAVCLGISSLQAQNTDVALARFRNDMAALNTDSKKKEVELKANPLAGLLVFRSMVTGVKTVQTDGLPDDLKAAFSEAITTLNRTTEVFDGWPDKPDEVLAYLKERMKEDPRYMENFSAKMNAMGKEMDAMSKKMDEMGKKYGFDNLQTADSPSK